MSTRARFYIQSVTLVAGDTATARLTAVSRGKENSEWAQFTPSGTLEMTLTRKASGSRQFFLDNIGREVYLDVTLADDPICTQCDEPILQGPGVTDYGQGVHLGNDSAAGGYAPGEFVHTSCIAAAKERLGAS